MHITIPDTGSPGGNDAVGAYAQPTGFYLAMVWVTFWPWSILLVPAAFHVVRRVRGKSAIAIDPRPYQFLLAWIVPMWIILELARGKLPHYPLPTYVGIAILCADAVVQSWHRMSDVLAAQWFHHARWGIFAVWTGLAAAVLVGAHLYLDSTLFWFCVPLAGALFAAGFAGFLAWNQPTWPFVTVLGWGAALLIASTLVLPNVKSLRVNKFAGTRMRELRDANPELHLAALGGRASAPDEPTLIFYAGSPVEKFGHLKGGLTKADYEELPEPMKAAYDFSKDYQLLTDAQKEAVKPDFEMYALTEKVANIPAMLEKIPFAPLATVTPKDGYIIAVDDGTRDVMRRWEPHLQFYELGRYEGVNVANRFKPISVTIITNIFLPREYVAASQSASEPASQPASAR
jgi:4-amino-4-deoxy-L-arabinose transferase-like glycosyltransferase